jgi:hypothetical protein
MVLFILGDGGLIRLMTTPMFGAWAVIGGDES